MSGRQSLKSGSKPLLTDPAGPDPQSEYYRGRKMPTRAPDQHALHFYSICGVVDLHVYVLQSISGGFLACLMTNISLV